MASPSPPHCKGEAEGLGRNRTQSRSVFSSQTEKRNMAACCRTSTQCCNRLFTIYQCQGIQQGTFTYIRVVGSICNRFDNYKATNFSTTCANSARGDSRIQKFRKVVDTFVAGSKQLGKDVKLMFEIHKKLKKTSYNWDMLKTEEIIHLHQVSQSQYARVYCQSTECLITCKTYMSL